MRYGKDDEETHESMQLKRYERKYMVGQPKRHNGTHRLRHRGESPHPLHKPKG